MNIAELEQAARIIAAGGIVAYPTEFCYGLGCDPRQHGAVRRLLRIKQRRWQLGLIVLAANDRQLFRYLDPTQTDALTRARASWPGPYTWLLPAHDRLSPWVRGEHATVAARVTDHSGAAALCRYARRAIISTSANRHGRPPARSAKGVRREFSDQVDYVLEGRLGALTQPTEIRDALTDEVVRAG